MTSKTAKDNKAAGKSMLINGSVIFIVGLVLGLLLFPLLSLCIIGLLMMGWGFVKLRSDSRSG
jgi:dolichol kinase